MAEAAGGVRKNLQHKLRISGQIKKHPYDGMGVFFCASRSAAIFVYLKKLSHLVDSMCQTGYFSGSVVFVVNAFFCSAVNFTCCSG